MLCILGGLHHCQHMRACTHTAFSYKLLTLIKEGQTQTVDDCIPVNAVVLNEITWCTLQEE